HIVVSPDGEHTGAGVAKTFSAEGFDAHDNSLGDVTGDTSFDIAPDGGCTGADCSATVAGDHTVTGTDASVSDGAILIVDAGPIYHIVVSPDGEHTGAGVAK